MSIYLHLLESGHLDIKELDLLPAGYSYTVADNGFTVSAEYSAAVSGFFSGRDVSNRTAKISGKNVQD